MSLKNNVLILAVCILSTALFALEPTDISTASNSEAVESPEISNDSPIPDAVIKLGILHAKYSSLSPKDWIDTPFPSPGDTVDGEALGVREKLAKHNIGYTWLNCSTSAYNLRDAPMAGYHGPANFDGQRFQLFNGERPTASTVQYLFMTYNVPSKELQFVWVPGTLQTSWNQLGPERPMAVTNGGLYVHKGFNNEKLGIEFGYLMNDIAFYESYIAGNLAGGTLGLDAPIPYEVGQNRSGLVTPSLRLRYQATPNTYFKVAFQRSVSPGGELQERKDNSEGTRFLNGDAKLLTISEIGYRREAAPLVNKIFVRADGWFNHTKYTDFRTIGLPYLAAHNNKSGLTDNNWAWSLAGDLQIKQTNKYVPFQGWYAGATAQYAPPQQNAYTQYYDTRLYNLGPFKSRPFDMFMVVVNHTVFSQIAMKSFESYAPLRQLYGNAYVDSINPQFGYNYFGDQTTFNVGYSIRTRPGVWIDPAITYSRHPTFAPRINSSPILARLGVSMFF